MVMGMLKLCLGIEVLGNRENQERVKGGADEDQTLAL